MIRKLVNAVLEAILIALSLIVPRTDKIWVVGGNRGLRYADNSMHFFRYCQRTMSRRVVWLTRSTSVLEEVRSEGYEAHLIRSVHGIRLGMRARWHVFDVGPKDTGPTSCGARRLNLWHGIPLKDISFLKRNRAESPDWRERLRRIAEDESCEYFVHPNRKYVSHILTSFHVQEQNVFLANLPRNEALLDSKPDAVDIKPRDLRWRDHLKTLRDRGRTVIGYFPTWRSDGEDRFLGTDEPACIDELNELLERHECTLVTKWHTCSYGEYNHSGCSRTAERLDDAIKRQTNIVALDFLTDLNPLLVLCDVLVTDYSSVLFDFLLTERPQYFVPYDLDRYQSTSGLLFDYESFVPGPIILDIPQLVAAIAALRERPALDIYAAKRAAMRKSFFEEERSSDRIVALMESTS